MNFQHIKAFCTIVAEGSFSRAAEILHLTQPTISAQIQILEKAAGARLFERSAQGISLTQAGRTFHTYATQMLELSTRATQAMEQLQGLARGELTLAASSVPGHYILPRLLAAFKAQWPAVQVRLSVSNSQAVRAGVRDNAFELGMVGERARDDRLTFDPVMEDHLVLVVRADHSLAATGQVDPLQLFDLPLVIRELGSGTRSTLERAMQRAGLSPERLKVMLELGSAEAVKAAVLATDWGAILSAWSVADDVRVGRLVARPIHGLDLHRSFYLVWRTHGYLSVASEQFIRFLRAHQPVRPEI
ncbi:MAG: LysR family transcriptional regulator [Armatimonadetes bacterium]|nr:LysR family transcriptional regulator [Armatimonadota bacterium]